MIEGGAKNFAAPVLCDGRKPNGVRRGATPAGSYMTRMVLPFAGRARYNKRYGARGGGFSEKLLVCQLSSVSVGKEKFATFPQNILASFHFCNTPGLHAMRKNNLVC
jgi:hypothetical protein